ncbi:Metallo-dependent phosphatase-like protein [Irpex rosettiformis]|uniref:Metallo-dependent phosphatase-like protein n=1 Tax=Irpex rosettiformis TaxID=378272 RepID=A0ACB8UFQ1_9APHY|nr:Metallo-dependent phosphatase-like protein [Irpex rosettiformis]
MGRLDLVNVLRVLWVVAIVWYELAVFSYQVSKCPWPRVPRTDSQTYPTPETHVLLVADPQVLDHRSYPDRPPWLMWLSQWIVDFNMRKSWWATKQLHPDAIIFLGDMMDGGRYAMSDDEYESYLRRTKGIFSTSPSIPELYIPGNHDVGIGVSDEWSARARDRWLSHFGPLQQLVEIANHTFVMLDAPGLVEEERQRKISGLSFANWAAVNPNGSIAYAQYAADMARSRNQPTVLLTHIPLFRPRGTSCGPLREHGTIRDGSGYGYENTLDPLTSEWILKGIRPSVIFSGDDHDYCEVYHTLPPSDRANDLKQNTVKEISVKSFSIAMGIHRPGFQLLSLIPPSSPSSSSSGPTFVDAPCFLPYQISTYVFVYGPLAAFSILVLLFSHVYRVNISSARPSMPASQSQYLQTLSSSPLSYDAEQVRSSALRPSNSNNTLQILRNYDAPDDTGEADFMLPPPSPTPNITAKARRRNGYVSRIPTVFRFSLGGRKMVADLTSVRDLLGACGGRCGGARGQEFSRSGRRIGVVRGWLTDVWGVGWVAMGVFLLLAWWFS